MYETASFAKDVLASLSRENMVETVNAFSTLHRYSGKEQGEASVDYLMRKCGEYGIACERESYEGFFSIPVSASLTIQSPYCKTYEACGMVFSGEASNLTAEVYYDYLSGQKNRTLSQERERDAAFSGKIVLSHDGRAAFADRLKKAGAAGLVYIWPSTDDMLHHSNIGPIWGTPDTRDFDHLTFLPSVSFRHSDGEEIAEACRAGKVYGALHIKMDSAIARSTMPIATIPGKTSSFVLLSAHYDSWYEGITDNAAADAIILEIGRVLQEKQDQLLRGVKICWWSGHSDGRYAGSAWWCDNHWEQLRRHCVAHVNLDICGCKNTGRIIMRTSCMEGMEYGADRVEHLTGLRPESYIPMVKGADQSFWGVNVPITVMAKNEPLPGNEKACGDFYGAGGGPWWHAIGDTLDKLDVDAMVRDAKLNAEFVADFATCPVLPVQILSFISEMKHKLKELGQGIDAAEFDIAPVYEKLCALEGPAAALEEKIRATADGASDGIIQAVAGELNRIFYTTVDPYSFEPAMSIAFGGNQNTTMGGLRTAVGVTRETTDAMTYLCVKTTFIRQRNRLVGQMNEILWKIEQYLRTCEG
ncbi:Zn-dependent exopeptidase M28 [Oscillibacter sp. MSJ-2]|uniref:Zn-dependent exopeptidase M28 n=1 Tax=Dysosmobacter acutus TaxID=2841504 RepID=A0ABS6F853_9FIRM|nr:M28 family peptidase [Dysosmobacter acutus]MBU5626460.1 Zn-dependent exopeptidase M28 [Dysosmobacter acutus]